MSPPASYLITVTTEQLRLAGKEPTRGWPAYSALHPDSKPTEVIHDPVFNRENFWNKAANDGCVAGYAMDRLAAALKAAQAVVVDPGEFRTLDEDARLLRSLVGRGFQVWEPKNRPARDGKCAIIGVWACVLGPVHRGSFLKWFLIWTPPIWTFEKRDSAK